MPDSIIQDTPPEHVAIACGGTGGHLFPGVAVGQELLQRGCSVTLMISPKDVDQQAVRSITGMGIVTLPAIGFQATRPLHFARGFWRSFQLAQKSFECRKPDYVLAMGGFTSAPPILAARRRGAKTFLHESNSIPGRANRWLARWVDGAFVYFPSAGEKLAAKKVEVVGMPVRPPFLASIDPATARMAMGLSPDALTVLVMGGSQGARGVNDLFLDAVPSLRQAIPNLQIIHLTGSADVDSVRLRYETLKIPAVIHAFWQDMATALAAADLAVSRSGASSLAELAARQLPAVLIPYPTAADNHQFFNADAFVKCGAARMVAQGSASAETLAGEILALLRDPAQRAALRAALAQWRTPTAASDIADRILQWPSDASRSRPVPDAPLKPHQLGTLNV